MFQCTEIFSKRRKIYPLCTETRVGIQIQKISFVNPITSTFQICFCVKMFSHRICRVWDKRSYFHVSPFNNVKYCILLFLYMYFLHKKVKWFTVCVFNFPSICMVRYMYGFITSQSSYYYFNYMHQDISPTSHQCLHNYTASI